MDTGPETKRGDEPIHTALFKDGAITPQTPLNGGCIYVRNDLGTN